MEVPETESIPISDINLFDVDNIYEIDATKDVLEYRGAFYLLEVNEPYVTRVNFNPETLAYSVYW